MPSPERAPDGGAEGPAERSAEGSGADAREGPGADAREDPAGKGTADGPGAWLRRLRLTNFRNFGSLEVELPPEGVAIVGPNGSGKTNFLEAVYYLEVFRSFRGANDRELVHFGEDVFRIEASLRATGGERGGSAGRREERQLSAAYERSGRRKKVELDRREVSRLSEAIGTLGAVVFSLEDVEIVRGSPEVRRRFLDILLSLVVPGYVDALREYRSCLAQRNEALREGAGRAALEAWSAGLVKAGAKVMAARSGWVAARAEVFARYHAAVAGGVRGRMRYEPSVGWPEQSDGPGPASDPAAGTEAGAAAPEAPPSAPAAARWAERFARTLSETAERERRRGVTVVGPQRDEVAFEARVAGGERRDLRTYGSGGQQRTAALALRLAEADTRRERLGREPLYLLDDVFAELDGERSARLLELLEEGRGGQVLVAAPKASELELRGGGLAEWRIRDGRIET